MRHQPSPQSPRYGGDFFVAPGDRQNRRRILETVKRNSEYTASQVAVDVTAVGVDVVPADVPDGSGANKP